MLITLKFFKKEPPYKKILRKSFITISLLLNFNNSMMKNKLQTTLNKLDDYRQDNLLKVY